MSDSPVNGTFKVHLGYNMKLILTWVFILLHILPNKLSESQKVKSRPGLVMSRRVFMQNVMCITTLRALQCNAVK